MQQVVVPHDVASFQVICDECLSIAGTDGAVARLVSGSIPKGEQQGVAYGPAGHRVEAVRVEHALAAAAPIGHAA